jgi:uncharacterized membrane protein YhaH (DUF805 family)
MTTMDWMLMPFRRYAEFSGRSRRKEYWMFALLIAILYTLLFILVGAGIFGGTDAETGELGLFGSLFAGAGGILFLLVILVTFIPSLAVTVRRLHDQDKSGWWVLINFVPYIGGIVLLVLMCLDGTRGPNRFGADPKSENSAEIFS